MNFYSKLDDKLLVSMQPLYDLTNDSLKLHWEKELGALFQPIKTYTTKDVTPTLINRSRPIFNTIDSSLFGTG